MSQFGRPLTFSPNFQFKGTIGIKVIYEVLYEARNRPTWLQIPLSAAAQLAER